MAGYWTRVPIDDNSGNSVHTRHVYGYTQSETDWCSRYRAWLEASTSIESRESRERHARAACEYIDWCQSRGIDPAMATPNDAARWINRPRLDGFASADSTRYVRRGYLITFYRWLMHEPGSCTYGNPAREVRVPRPDRAEPVTPMRLLHADESAAVLVAADEWTGSPHRSRNRVVAALLVHHGMRPAEIRRARLAGYRRPRSGRAATLRTAIRRSTPQTRLLHPEAVERIEHYLRAVRVGPVRGRGDWLLLSATGAPLDTHSIARLVRVLAVRAGIEDAHEVTPYSFRRSLLNDGRDAGLDLGRISALAGHCNEATTVRYLRRIGGAVDASPVWDYRSERLAAAS